MPCFVTYSFIVTVLRTKLNFLSGLCFAVHILRLFLLQPMLNCTVHFLPCLKTCCYIVALEAILDYTTCSFEGNSSLFPAGVMPCFTILFYFTHCSFPCFYVLLLTCNFCGQFKVCLHCMSSPALKCVYSTRQRNFASRLLRSINSAEVQR